MLSKRALERYQNLSQQEKKKKSANMLVSYIKFLLKKKKCQCGLERYKNLLKDEKQTLVEYIKLISIFIVCLRLLRKIRIFSIFIFID